MTPPPIEEPDAAGEFDESVLHGRILRSSGWVAVSLGGKQLASFLSLLVLARLLDPKAFGLVSLSWTVLAFVQQIQESGVGAAIVHRRTSTREAAGVALLWAPLASLFLYAATFLVAPVVAHLLHADGLTPVLRVLALVLLLRGLMVVPSALLERELDFRGRTKADVTASLAQMGVALPLAFAGLGVWSLVAGALAGAGMQTVVLWLVLPWRPRPRFDLALLRELIRYGRFVGLGNMLGVLDNTIDNLVVARLLGTRLLGFYSVAFRLADFPNSVIGHVVSRVMFPVYSMLQADRQALRRAYLQNLQRIALVAFPVSVGIVVAAEPIVMALLGSKWLIAVTPLRILGVYGLIKSLASPSGEVFKGIGKPHLGPAFSVPHLLLAVPILYPLTKRFGLNGAAVGILLVLAAVGLPAIVVAARQVGATLSEVAVALALPALCAGVCGVALTVLLGPAETLPPVAALLVLVVAGVLVFAAAALAFGRPVLLPMWSSLRATRN